MDVGGAFIRVYGLEVADVAYDLVLVDDAVASEHVSASPRDVEGLRAGVPLHHRDQVGVELPRLLHAGGLQHRIQTNRDLREGICHLKLDELVGSQGALELVAVHGVLTGSLQAELCGTPGAPSNAKPAEFRHAKGPRMPVTFGSTFSFGIFTSSSWIMPVGEARSENLPSILGVDRPSMPRSTMKPRTLSSVDVLAQTMQMSAMGELVIQFLAPLSK
eukprot:CAMPEP_0179190664 /NCGR_PEP_ID=MMETSP0796-20121207/94677_1 /TAXON_ID=73915 /ORGANISM="Pyrodinium bahamense, Strain pbaha01" /LENGTH=217 /DNA_ID=CAMNT_0020894843 /DNA_START=257 /DNA_END=911 /DNA_ORIENTATION=-